MRFLHVADVHLDTSFAGRSESVRQRLREASREAFRRAVDLAIREEVHAFLVAGDLFDSDRLSLKTERFMLEQMARLGDHGITVVYATGNHDPGAAPNGPRRLAWPQNVHVVSEATPRRILVADASGDPVGYVTAAGHASAEERADLSRGFPRPSGELPQVALLHTQVHHSLGAHEHHPYAPSELSFLLRSGYDYWALGHVHERQGLSEDPPVTYAGSLQGRSHAERGERGAILVDLSDRDAPAVRFCPLAPVRWETLSTDRLEGVRSLDELLRHLQLAWEGERRREGPSAPVEWMVRVVLSGPSPLWSELRSEEDAEHVGSELREVLGALEVTVSSEHVHPVLALGEYAARIDVLGEALRLCAAMRRGESKLDVTAADFAGIGTDDARSVDAYVRALLEGADGELAARLVETPGT
ncbi:MAG: DNA repair exonuclease [Gemmatimonadetes bacterium]|nr:DNA repair exonuclease [Gemmatimonadota bacterium]